MGGDLDWEKKADREKENAALPVGDPNTVWSFGCESKICSDGARSN